MLNGTHEVDELYNIVNMSATTIVVRLHYWLYIVKCSINLTYLYIFVW